ncbi:hypothetical protein PROVRETT_09330 [Providencia rettgeri DSM 1131]|nr:hypothetical protein PROVRETT_09330 [Providencia rettgeri DSM 1131]
MEEKVNQLSTIQRVVLRLTGKNILNMLKLRPIVWLICGIFRQRKQ